MKVPFFDLSRRYERKKNMFDQAVLGAMASGKYLLAEQCTGFEHELIHFLMPGLKGAHLTSCASGTDALILSLLACNVDSGDEVITVSHTAIPTVSAIQAVGASPVFVDVESETWVMDSQQIANALTPKTRAIIPVHLYGNMADIPAIQKILKQVGREDVYIVEDAAQALGAKWLGSSAGTLGRMGAFSFYPTKNLGAFGDGGAVLCHDPVDLRTVQMLRVYGQSGRYRAEIPRGINSRLDEIQAAILRSQLSSLQQSLEVKSRWVAQYRKALEDLPLSFQNLLPGCEPAWSLFAIRLENEKTRDALAQFLLKEGVETLIHYPVPNHRQPAFVNLGKYHLPVTESLVGEILSLPMNQDLRADEFGHVVKSIRAFFGASQEIDGIG